MEPLVAWLKKHPEIEIISRDRARNYAEAASQGAPQATQVADRWHLVKNLGDTVQAELERYRSRWSWPLSDAKPGSDETLSSGAIPVLSSHAERMRLANRAKRLARYEKVMALCQQGLTARQIAQKMSISQRTVQRFIAAGSFPERKRRSSSPSLLHPYVSYLEQRWNEGCHTIAQLFLKPPDDLAAPEQTDLAQLKRLCPHGETIYQLTQRFVRMVRQQQPDELPAWLQAANTPQLPEFQRFVHGLRQDYSAVVAALSLKWSNGQVEGQVNRLKLVKRQMYGRASFDLLRQRVLHSV